jgi:hypothetical protein
MALLLFLGEIVLQLHFAAAHETRLHQHQRAVGVDRQRGGFFLEFLALRIVSANSYGDLHQNSLAAAAGPGMWWSVRRLTHKTSSIRLYRAAPESREACLLSVCKKATREKGSAILGTLEGGNQTQTCSTRRLEFDHSNSRTQATRALNYERCSIGA